MHYTSHRTVLPEHNARYENGDTLTLGDGTEWEYFEASGWVPVAVRPVTNPVTGGVENSYGGVLRRVARALTVHAELPIHAAASSTEGAWSADLTTALVVAANAEKFRVSGGVKADTSTTSYKVKAATVAVGNLGLGEAYGTCSAIEFLVSGASSVRAKAYASGSGTLYYRAFVDDRPLSAGPVAISGTGNRAITITMPDALLHRIRIECDQGTFWQTVSVDAGYVVSPQEYKPTALFVGDSYYNAGASRSPIQSVAWRAAQMLGFNAILSAVGSTGYAHNGGSNYEFAHAKRLADVAAFSGMAEVVVISGGTNDGGKTIAEIKAAATTTIANAKQYHPNARIFVTGCWNYNVGTAGKQLEIEQAVAEVVAEIGGARLHFIPILTDLAGAWTTAANIGTIIAADGTHARAEVGEVYFAQRLAQRIADIF